jgi:hypothetical protein
MKGSIDVKRIREDTYSLTVDVAFHDGGKATIIAGLQNVDVVLRAVGVPLGARAKALDDVKAHGLGTTGIVQLSGEQLSRLGLL